MKLTNSNDIVANSVALVDNYDILKSSIYVERKTSDRGNSGATTRNAHYMTKNADSFHKDGTFNNTITNQWEETRQFNRCLYTRTNILAIWNKWQTCNLNKIQFHHQPL